MNVATTLILSFLSSAKAGQKLTMKVATYATELAPGPGLANATKHVAANLKNADIDMICMQGVEIDQDAVKEALPDYPYVYKMTKAEGSTSCKCEAEEVGLVLGDAMKCMGETCKGAPNLAVCLLSDQCLGKHKPTLNPRCIGCIASTLGNPAALENPMLVVSECTRSKNDAPRDETLACEGPYKGSYGVALASKHPLTSTKSVHFPNSLVANRGFAHVTVEPFCGYPVEVLCGFWRGNDTVPPRSMQLDLGPLDGYFPPQPQTKPETFYGGTPSTPAEEAMMQAKYTGEYLGKELACNKFGTCQGSKSVAVLVGNFAVGPTIESANIGNANPDVYKAHEDAYEKQNGFSNPMVAAGKDALCSDCVAEMMSAWYKSDPAGMVQGLSAWSGQNMTDDQVQTMMSEQMDMLIDHAWIKGTSATSDIAPFRTPLTHEGIRYPVGVTFTIDVGDSTGPCATTAAPATNKASDGSSDTTAVSGDSTSSTRKLSAVLASISTCSVLAFFA